MKETTTANKYKSVYYFLVIDEIMSGKAVFALDRQNFTTIHINEMSVDEMVELINNAKKDESERYVFWTKEEEENENA